MAGFHNLAYQETDGPVLARLKVGYGLGILGQDFVHDLADGAGIADLLQSQFLYQGLGCFVVLYHLGKDFLGQLAGKHALADQIYQACQMFRADLELVDGDGVVVQISAHVAQNPVSQTFHILGLFGAGIVVIRHLFGGHDQRGAFFGDTGGYQALFACGRQFR